MIKSDLTRQENFIPIHSSKLDQHIDGPSLEILLIEDHPLYRDGLKFCLSSSADNFTPKIVVLEAADVHTALQRIIQNPKIRVAVVDVFLPGLNGIDGIKQLLNVRPKLSCIVLTSNVTSQTIEKAKRAGAAYVIDKSTPCTEIRSTICRIANASSAHVMANDFLQSIQSHHGKLTERQVEITKLLAHGLRNKVIGDQLGISENTVRIHLSNIFRALGCTSRTEVVHVARSLGILE